MCLCLLSTIVHRYPLTCICLPFISIKSFLNVATFQIDVGNCVQYLNLKATFSTRTPRLPVSCLTIVVKACASSHNFLFLPFESVKQLSIYYNTEMSKGLHNDWKAFTFLITASSTFKCSCNISVEGKCVISSILN